MCLCYVCTVNSQFSLVKYNAHGYKIDRLKYRISISVCCKCNLIKIYCDRYTSTYFCLVVAVRILTFQTIVLTIESLTLQKVVTIEGSHIEHPPSKHCVNICHMNVCVKFVSRYPVCYPTFCQNIKFSWKT